MNRIKMDNSNGYESLLEGIISPQFNLIVRGIIANRASVCKEFLCYKTGMYKNCPINRSESLF